jgi:hypothetical protein
MQDRRAFDLKTFLIGAFGLIFGLLLVMTAEHVERDAHPLLRGLLEATAISLITGGFLGLAYEFLLRKELIRHFDESVSAVIQEVSSVKVAVDRRIGLAQNLDKLGLSEICPRESHYDYTRMIHDSQELFFAFNDGRTWFSNHEHDLHARAARIEVETSILLLHPESPFITALGAKVAQSPDDLRRKIDETIRMLVRLPWQGKLRIYGHMMPTSYSLVLSEERAVFVPYHMARKVDKSAMLYFQRRSRGWVLRVVTP